MDDRERILSRLPASGSGSECPRDAVELAASELSGWELFRRRLSDLGGHTIRLDSPPFGAAILRALDDLGFPARHAVVDDDARVLVELESTADVWTADVGVTLADSAIAEVGGLIVSNMRGRRRLASLAPPVHVALVREDALCETLEEALDTALDRTTVMIVGPSRTADIEGVLVRGVHGPRELVVAIIRCTGT